MRSSSRSLVTMLRVPSCVAAKIIAPYTHGTP